ncbi:IclR family transcriptional regulator [Petrotoga sp. SL27]|uniref:IclR family transcriptional regulator n=1 Tax=Petrotoga sp. SL27 TaxID=1445612 RepID=UPI002100F9C5|nr:IclR family transcriptional regulator [Petrotoga sp. SL27]
MRKVIEVLDYIVYSPKPVNVTEIAREFDMSMSNAYKYLDDLYKGGLLSKNSDKSYFPSFKLVEYGSIILKKVNLREIAHPHLVDLMVKTGQTVHLAIKEGYEGIYIEKIEGPNSLPMMSRIGMKMNLYATGFGKAILAHLPEKEVEEYLKIVEQKKRGKNTITDPNELKNELKKIRKRGYAIDNEENEIGIFCIGAPIFNYDKKVIAGVSISMSVARAEEKKVDEYIRYVMECAKNISEFLGHKG